MQNTVRGDSKSPLIKRPQRLADEVYKHLYGRLMSLAIAPGSRILIDNLVKEMGVSHTPNREALSRLEAQGLVVQTHLVGYSAASQLDPSKLVKLFDMRLQLEPFAAGQAALHITDEAAANLQDINQSMQEIESSELRGRFLDFAQSDGELHDLIARMADNELIHEALQRLHTHVHLFRLFYLPSATKEVNAEHAEIVHAIGRRNEAAAAAAMRAHLDKSKRRFLAQCGEKP